MALKLVNTIYYIIAQKRRKRKLDETSTIDLKK